MQYQEFLEQVEKRIDLKSSGEAITAIRATLETFADHLAGNAPAKLAAQLPEEIAKIITDYKSDPEAEGEGFGVEEFVSRVAERIGLNDKETARKHATTVLAIVQEAISPGEWEKLSGTFPAEYKTLFEAEQSDVLSARQF